nr:ribonuclease H-like domain-containing protein [Tanacetum cinerariifolium]
MYNKYNALVKNGTWLLVSRPVDVNMVRSMWLFKHKFHVNETLSRYKARLVANGSSQQLGVDFDETFSLVVKPATIHTVLSLVVSRQWPVHQLDVKNAFLNGDLSKTVYMCQSLGFIDNRYPHHVCVLQRSLYRLKQAPRAWFQRFAGYAIRAEFYHSLCDSLFFIYRHGSQVAYLLINVDDTILTASCPTILQQIIGSLNSEFDMTDLGALNYFFGISADGTPTGLFLSQKKYALQLLERAHMVTCNPSRTPVDIESKLGPKGAPIQDLTLYRSLAGGLQYLTFTRPDLSYAGTLDLGLHLYASSTTSLVGYTDVDWAGCPSTCMSTSETTWLCNLLRELRSPLSTATLVYCDNVSAVYMFANPVQHQRTKHIEIDIHFVRDMVTAGQIVDSLHKEFDMIDLGALNNFLGISVVRHPTGLFLSQNNSTLGYCVSFGDNLLSWSVKRQHTISHSSAKAEYRGVANIVAETAWVHNLLRELHFPLMTATLVYCDNLSVVYMSTNLVQYQRTKHIKIDIHFVRDMVKACHVRVLHVSSCFQYADIFTKGLPSALFEDFRSSLSFCPLPVQIAMAY